VHEVRGSHSEGRHLQSIRELMEGPVRFPSAPANLMRQPSFSEQRVPKARPAAAPVAAPVAADLSERSKRKRNADTQEGAKRVGLGSS
jgi:hypothetical protein